MEKAFRKLLRQILLKDYPMFADVHVTKVDNPFRFGGGYEVFLVILQDEWDKITDDEKKKPNEGKMKFLFDQEIVGMKKISKIEGDKISFEDADFTKTMADILMKTEEVKAEGQEDLVKKLGDLKTKKPEDIKKVGSFVDFISDEANKDKVAEIEKIMGAGAEGGEAGA